MLTSPAVAKGCLGGTTNTSSSRYTTTKCRFSSCGSYESTPNSAACRKTSSGIWLPNARSTVILIIACTRRNSASTGSKYKTVNSFAAITSLPFCSSLNSDNDSAASPRKLISFSAYSYRTLPASVSTPSRDERSNNASPSSSSSLRIVWLTADCVRNSLSAAREKRRSRATARKTSNWESSMCLVMNLQQSISNTYTTSHTNLL